MNVVKEYYATEKKMIHKIGYTIALGLMAIGVVETAHSIPYIIKGESSPIGIAIGPVESVHPYIPSFDRQGISPFRVTKFHAPIE